MKSKEFVLDEQTTIKVSKRSSSRRIRLSIGPDGQVKVSIPSWLPYRAAVEFARTKLDWIHAKAPDITVLGDGQQIGKNHHLVFKATAEDKQITTRLKELEAVVFYPSNLSINDPKVQVAAKKLAKRAMLAQGKQLLPIRLQQLADKYGYSYNQVIIKSLKTRWGSCDSHKNISLNLYLMELPWYLIDYVLVHELNHTKVMHHGPKFWSEMEQRLKNTKELRKELKQYKAVI